MLDALVSAVAGAVWCALFGEYLLHRFVFHGSLGRRWRGWHPAIEEHIRHHK
jgi:hypothetical protein